ncbi:MAG: porin [Sutterella wadsworthensis]
MKTQALRLTRLAAAAAFAAAFSVQAADFSVYGIVDTGIIVEHNKMGSQPSSTSAREEFGVNLGPRIGLTGTEDLGNGTKVKMLLENLFESDDGEMLFSRLWGGEASLALEGSMGEIAVGRMGALVSPFGHWGIFGMQATPSASAGAFGRHALDGGRRPPRQHYFLCYADHRRRPPALCTIFLPDGHQCGSRC